MILKLLLLIIAIVHNKKMQCEHHLFYYPTKVKAKIMSNIARKKYLKSDFITLILFSIK